MLKSDKLAANIWRVLTRPITSIGRHQQNPFEKTPPPLTWRQKLRRTAAALAWRLLFTPVMLVVVMVMLVFGTTHRLPWARAASPSPTTPTAVNVFYRDVQLMTSDGQMLAAWHIPAWDAGSILEDGEKRVLSRRPALVLCHGAWGDRSQLLYLAPALHAAGYELLLIDARGCGESGGRTGLGLDEWSDIRAAVDWLRRTGPVDPHRIGIIACDLNAAAALKVAAACPDVCVVVADRPAATFSSFINQRFDALGLPGFLLGRLYEWSFTLGRGADTAEVSAQRWAGRLTDRQSLMVAGRVEDPRAPSHDGQLVVTAAHGPTTLRVSPFSADPAAEPTLLPNELISFLSQSLPVSPPASQPDDDVQ